MKERRLIRTNIETNIGTIRTIIDINPVELKSVLKSELIWIENLIV